MSAENKTAIISIGGGMRSAYGAGFLYALGAKLGITNPDIVVASSGGTGNAMYFLTGQYEDMKHIWNELLPTRRFVSWLRIRPIMDVDYLIDDVMKGQFRLKTEVLERNSSQYFIPLFDTSGECIRLISKEDDADIYEVLRASKSIPFFYGKDISVLGRTYVDGGVAIVVNDMIQYAREHGAQRILIINNRTQLTMLKRFVLLAYAYLFASRAGRGAITHWLKYDDVPFNAGDATCLLIQPKITMWTATKNPRKIRALFQMGIDDALAREQELRTLLT